MATLLLFNVPSIKTRPLEGFCLTSGWGQVAHIFIALFAVGIPVLIQEVCDLGRGSLRKKAPEIRTGLTCMCISDLGWGGVGGKALT